MADPKNQPPESSPSSPSKTVKIKPCSTMCIIIAILAAFVLGTAGGYLLGQKQTQFQLSPSPTPDNIPLSTPIPTSDPTDNWKTYRNEEFGITFDYPSNWSLIDSVHKETPEIDKELFIRLEDNVPYKLLPYSNTITIYNDRRKKVKGNLAEDSQSYINYTLDYIPAISYNSPKIQKVSDTKINTYSALKYDIVLTNVIEKTLASDKITIIHTYNKKLWSFELYGDNSEQFNQILSTFKFLN